MYQYEEANVARVMGTGEAAELIPTIASGDSEVPGYMVVGTVRRDLTRYEELDKEAQAQMNEELSGWKLVVGDVHGWLANHLDME
ncbi:hypothetical protein Tsubulata_014112 [Turnera subulata]|uniref:Uncharacterized protein n=1 Tax=Turnera subulata TaxID=218843 RepID=A0A9Q0JMY2_9ROSI|nr:hypothetical protein Tsubulata_014112 [Turnera subulata]